MQTSAEHKVKPLGIEYVEVAGDEKAMREWIGADVPLKWTSAQAPSLVSVGIKTVEGVISLK